ncbi:SusC/RagA family TonB-linked outer membrane protein [Flavobacterium gilvum]|nr:SusC/RagA family TonB-linked outer membrane protein [Flavobacterium gilvum]
MKVNLVLFLAFLTQIIFAQERAVSGVVSDDAGLPIPGVSITLKGTKEGTQTDLDGKYTLKVKPEQILVFSYVGLKTQERKASATTINVKMLSDANELKDVVVTSMGIKREKKSLGYSTQEVSGKDLNGGTANNNVASLLSGKAAGVEVTRNTNFGGSTNVVIRGNKSLTGNNQALWVIDGVPVDNTNSNEEVQKNGKTGYDYGNAASDINQEDIESVNVLKGAAATALYGARAANGVVMVTTKKGKSKKSGSIGVTFSTGFSVGTIDKKTFPEYQTKYGSGYGFGSSFLGTDPVDTVDTSNDASLGDKYDSSKLVYQWDAFTQYSPNFGKATPWQAAKNGPITFFNNSKNFNNSLTIEKGTEDSNFLLSYNKLDQTGIMPNSKLAKNQISARFNQKITDKLSATAYASVTLQDTKGRNSTGYSDNILGAFRQWWSVNTDIQAQKEAYFNSGGQNISWNWADPTSEDGLVPAYWDNPYFTRYQNYNTDERTRLLSYATLNYQINDWLSAMGRVSLDTYNELQEERRAIGSVANPFGLSPVDETSGYQRKDIHFQEINYDVMLNFNKRLSDDFSINGVAGLNIRRNLFDSVKASTIGGLVVPGLYALGNSKYELPFPSERRETIGVNGIYLQGSVGYLDTYFIDASIRRDVSSTLPAGNNSYIYPAISGSVLYSKLLNQDWLNLGKFRMNYAEVGNSAPVNSLVNTYDRNPNFGGEGSYYLPNTNNNPNLKPERTKSFEIGLENSMLNRRLGFDITYYNTKSVDQIVSAAVSASSAFTSAYVNGGTIQNQGVELQLTGTPVKTNDFTWDVTVNWSRNKSTVLELPQGVENLQLGSYPQGITINATPGQPYGTIKGSDYIYTNGQKTVDQTTGKYLMTTSSDNIIGNINPDWIAGIRNKFNYKDFSLSFLIDSQKGGDIFSLDMAYGLAGGLYKETAVGDIRENGVVHSGVAPDGKPNTIPVQNPGSYENANYGYYVEPSKAFVYDASFVKLREVSIAYNIPTKWLSKQKIINEATFSVVGSNLWIIYKDLPYADPESGLGSGVGSRGYSLGSLPTTRDFGFNLKLKF